VLAQIENPYLEAEVKRAGNRMALENIRERLQLFFDAEARIAIKAADGRYRVELEIPIKFARMSELKVFIADDEEPARERLKDAARGHRAGAADRGGRRGAQRRRGLDLLPPSGAQVLLLDIQMPGMGGLEVARHLARLEQPPRIIFVTAHDRHAVEAFELNALDYLLKPVRAERLAGALKKATVPENAKLEKAAESPREYLSLAERNRIVLLPVRDILYLRAEEKVRHRAHAGARAPGRRAAGRARARVRDALRAHPPQLPGGACRDPRLRARAGRRGRGALAGGARRLDERLPVSRRQWPTVRDLVT
jgi:two-component system response regulator AlgR